MNNTALFSTSGHKSSDSIAFGAAVFIIGIALLFYSLITRGEVIGPWYYYATGIIITLVLLVFGKKKNAVTIQLRDSEIDPVITVIGNRGATDFNIANYSYWRFEAPTSNRQTTTVLHIAFLNDTGEVLGLLGSKQHNDSLHEWSSIPKEIPSNVQRYTVENLAGFAKALDEHFSDRRIDHVQLPF